RRLGKTTQTFPQFIQRVIAEEIIFHTLPETRAPHGRSGGSRWPMVVRVHIGERPDVPPISSGHGIGYGVMPAPTKRYETADSLVTLAPEELDCACNFSGCVSETRPEPSVIRLEDLSPSDAKFRICFKFREQLFVVTRIEGNVRIEKSDEIELRISDAGVSFVRRHSLARKNPSALRLPAGKSDER